MTVTLRPLLSLSIAALALTAHATPVFAQTASTASATSDQASTQSFTPLPNQFHIKDKDAKRPALMPGKNELEIREKLETLANLSPQQLDAELQKWPRYQQMDLGERAKILQRIQEFKDRRRKAAENKARELGLKLTPEQFSAFEKEYSGKRSRADRQLWQEMEPRRKALDQQINAELRQQFGS